MKRQNECCHGNSKRPKVDKDLRQMKKDMLKAKNSKDYAKMRRIGEKILEIEPSYLRARSYIMSRIGLSSIASEQDLEAAVAHAKCIVESKDATPSRYVGAAYAILGHSYAKKHQFSISLDNFHKAIAHDSRKAKYFTLITIRRGTNVLGESSSDAKFREMFMTLCHEVLPDHEKFFEDYYNDFHEAMKICDEETWLAIDPIVQNPIRLLVDCNGDGFVNWSILTPVHRRFIKEKYPEIEKNLIEYSVLQKNYLLVVNDVFTDATIGGIHSFLYHM